MSQSHNNSHRSLPGESNDPNFMVPIHSPDSNLRKTLENTQAEIDRMKAEELIAALSDSDETATLVSFSTPEVESIGEKPGSFAEQDPYIDPNQAGYLASSSVSKPKSLGTPQKTVNTTSGKEKTDKKAPQVAPIPKPQANSINNPDTTTETISAKSKTPPEYSRDNPPKTAGERGNRTVEDILAMLPDYNEAVEAADIAKRVAAAEAKHAEAKAEVGEPKAEAEAPKLKSIFESDEEVVLSPISQAAPKRPDNPTQGNPEQPKSPTQSENQLSLPTETPKNEPTQRQSLPMIVGEEAFEPPVSWYSDAKSSDQEAVPSAPQTPASVPVMTEDPVTGEKVYDINDFSELAEKPILAIPGALKSDPANDDDSKVTRNLEGPKPEQPAQRDAQAKPKKRVSNPVKIKFPSMAAIRDTNAAKAELKSDTERSAQAKPNIQPEIRSEAAPTAQPDLKTPSSPSLDNPLLNKGSMEAARENTANAIPNKETDPKEKPVPTTRTAKATTQKDAADSKAGSCSLLAKPSNKNQSKTVDDELAAAFAACDKIDDPILDQVPVSFSEETFDDVVSDFEALRGSNSDSEDTNQPESKPAVQAKDANFKESWKDSNEGEELFLAGEGDVIQIDGDDGYDFIDLACFPRSAAKITGDRILVTEECGSTFQVQFKNVAYIEFANGERVELPASE